MNQATTVTATAASSSSRRGRPSTTPASTAGVADRGSGTRGVSGGLSRSASLASATGGRFHPQHAEQEKQGLAKGTKGQPQSGTRAATVEAGAGRGGSASKEQFLPLSSPGKDGNTGSNNYSGGEYHDDPEAGHFAAEAATAAAALASSEWARQRRQALACAGSMEVPVGASSSASAGAGSGGGDAQLGSSVLLFGFGSGSVGEEALSLRGCGSNSGDGRGSPFRSHGKASIEAKACCSYHHLHDTVFEGTNSRDLASTVQVTPAHTQQSFRDLTAV